MSIRPVDMNVVIPKTPEVQKAKSVEAENPMNNNLINLHQEQHNNEQKQIQVNKKENPEAIKIKDDRQKRENNKDNKKKEQTEEEARKEEENKHKPKTSIDIKI